MQLPATAAIGVRRLQNCEGLSRVAFMDDNDVVMLERS